MYPHLSRQRHLNESLTLCPSASPLGKKTKFRALILLLPRKNIFRLIS